MAIEDTKLVLDFGEIAKLNLKKGDQKVIRTTLGKYLDWRRDEKVIDYENNRGIFGPNPKTIAKIRKEYNKLGLNIFSMALMKDKGVCELVDAHGRTWGLERRWGDGGFTKEDMEDRIDIKIYCEEERHEAYQLLNDGKAHTTREKVSNPDLPIGKLYAQLDKRIVNRDEIPGDSFMNFLDFLLCVNDNSFKEDVAKNLAAIKSARGVISRLTTEKKIDVKISDKAYQNTALAVDFYKNFREELLRKGVRKNKDGTVSMTKNGTPAIVPAARDVANSTGLMLFVIMDQLTTKSLTKELLLKNAYFDLTKPSAKKAYDQLLGDSKILAQRGLIDDQLDAHESLTKLLTKTRKIHILRKATA